ncbi:FtsQ-type POTRA domain-containing protein [Patescibacteria group bacterium]|nr:FtsQ-type POTRA domain-containing protein [Patescibacteria group bacterium]
MFRKKRKSGVSKLMHHQNLAYKNQDFKKFKKKKPNPISHLRIKSGLIILILATIAIIYLLFFSNYFLLEKIEFADNNLENEGLSTKISESISNQIGKNLFTIETDELEQNILKNYPELETVKISKDYPKKLTIEFGKYPLVANLINETENLKKSYILNSIGVIVKENYESPTLPYIKINSVEPINKDGEAITQSTLKYILDCMVYFQEKFGMQVREAYLKPTARELHLLTEKDFYIWLDIQVPYEEQLKKLKKALVKLDIFNTPLQYIDLRISGKSGEKIIYKRR